MQPYMAEWRERGLVVVLISADHPDQLAAFVAEHDLEIYVLLDPDHTVHRLYGVQARPTSIFLNREGRVEHSSVGWSRGALEEFLDIAKNI